jgi:hypothetical protein
MVPRELVTIAVEDDAFDAVEDAIEGVEVLVEAVVVEDGAGPAATDTTGEGVVDPGVQADVPGVMVYVVDPLACVRTRVSVSLALQVRETVPSPFDGETERL